MWQIKIQDPSGETRVFPLRGSVTLGRSNEASIPLRDPTAPHEAATLLSVNEPEPHSYWLKVPSGAPNALLGDLPVREAYVPAGLPIMLGETQMTLESTSKLMSDAQPVQPAGIRHWLTASEEGKRLLWTAKKSATTPLSIYIAGETGTGKEVIAQLIHTWSDRASGPFIPLHCGALPISLAESELFGHVKGAFTGASHQRSGALMQAHGGTLFLDEVGDLPLDIQVKLLRFLENGEIRPIGADKTSRADVRVLCATHHPLHKLVEEGRFRRDLYYRLASVTLQIPPLRVRPNDIVVIASYFARELDHTISPKAMLRLKAHAWPGNVRELRHGIERACGLAGPFLPVLTEMEFDFLLSPENMVEVPELALGAAVLSMEEMERALLIKALRISSGNRTQAAKVLGIARSTLFVMLKRHKIQGPRRPCLLN